jgi:hypothetical protein
MEEKDGRLRYWSVELRLPAEEVVPLGVITSTWTVAGADESGLRQWICL